MRFLLQTIAAALLATASAAQADIKIGAVLSVTGPASFLGDPEKKTLEMYVADINARGGINGQQVKLFVYDDGGDPNQARTFGTRAIEQDGVDALLAGSTTATTMAIIPLAEDAQDAADQLCRRRAGGEPGEEMEFQDAAHRPDGVREDLRGPEEAQPDESRADLRHRCVRQVDARPVHDGDRQIRHRGVCTRRPTARATAT